MLEHIEEKERMILKYVQANTSKRKSDRPQYIYKYMVELRVETEPHGMHHT